MKNTINIIVAILLMFNLSACMDPVNFDPTNRYTSSLGFDNEKNVRLYLNSFYPILQQYSQFGGSAMGGNSTMSDGLTDVLKYGGIVAGTGDANLIMTVDGYLSSANNPFNTWSSGYSWVRRINEFLFELDKYKSKYGAQAESFEAEARFFRAYIYFLIMRSHASEVDDAGIIIHDNILTMTAEKKEKARSTIAQSWDFIEAELNFCTTNDRLPKANYLKGQVNYYAAQALMARAMLYAKRYDKAIAAARTIQNVYAYGNDYASIFKDINDTQKKEVILGVYWQYPDLTHNFDLRFAPAGDILGQGLLALAAPTQEFVDMYDMADGTPFNLSNPAHSSIRFVSDANVNNRDPRLKASVLYNNAEWKNRRLTCYYDEASGNYAVDMKNFPYSKVNTPGNTVTGYYMRKLVDESNNDFVSKGSDQDWAEFRYAETMLILAECLAQTPAGMAESRQIMHDLRKNRFKNDAIAAPTYNTTADAVDFILKERAIELAFEGHRFWDLRRTGKALEVLNAKRYSAVKWTKHSDGTFSAELVSADTGIRRYHARYDAFPLPDDEIRNNPLAIQNKDW